MAALSQAMARGLRGKPPSPTHLNAAVRLYSGGGSVSTATAGQAPYWSSVPAGCAPRPRPSAGGVASLGPGCGVVRRIHSASSAASSSSGAAGASASCEIDNFASDRLDIDLEEGEGFIAEQCAQSARFRLSPKFVAKFRDIPPPFGFTGLGEFVFQTRYARVLPDGTKEAWYQCCERVVSGTYNMQKRWIESHELGWNAWRAQKSAQEMFRRIFSMKFLPPGRGLWAMGSPLTEERFLYAALNNCAFVSTEHMREDPVKPFCFLMDAAMLGVGVGFDTAGAGTVLVKGVAPAKGSGAPGGAVAGAGSGLAGGASSVPDGSPSSAASGAAGVSPRAPADGDAADGSLSSSSVDPLSPAGRPGVHVIADSREGWVESLKVLLHAYFAGLPRPVFDYSRIRPRGAPIKGFGGTASGPDVLQRLHEDVDSALAPLAGRAITVTGIADVMNMIGRCVVSGDVRQTAEIAFGRADDPEYVNLKNYAANPQRAAYGWTSNNSVFAELGMAYDGIAERIRDNGEPGFAWLENMRRYSRMGDAPDDKDSRAQGGNPCLEQTLESYELCCLVETFPNNHKDLDDFKRTLKYAYLYAKTVTLGRTHWPTSNRVMLRNRRIGCSMSGIAQFIAGRGMHELRRWCDRGYETIQEYDKRYSDWLAIPRSIKTTCVKPSGTVSLLAGATPGIHYPESRFYLRRVRVGVGHEVVEPLRRAGYHVEPAVEDPSRKVVITFPVDAGEGIRTLDQISMWEQFSLSAFMQRHWADNQVSCTITFDPEREGPQIARALDIFQYQLKGVSMLPRAPTAAYKQLPYEAVTQEQYEAEMAKITPMHFGRLVGKDATAPDRFCDTSRCDLEIPLGVSAAASAAPEAVGAEGARVSRMTKPTV